MRKLRNDSTWNLLTTQQRQALEIWLFEDNLGYMETLERVKAQFGIQSLDFKPLPVLPATGFAMPDRREGLDPDEYEYGCQTA